MRTTSKERPIVIVIPSLDMGGTERQTAVLIHGLIERHPELANRLHVVAMTPGGALEQDVLSSGVHLHSLKQGKSTIVRFLYFVHMMRNLEPLVIYSLLNPANFISALARPFLRRPVRLIWGIRSEHATVGSTALKTRLTHALIRTLGHCSDGVIVNAYAAAEYAEVAGLPRNKIQVIPNGVDTNRFRPNNRSRLELRRELAIDIDSPVVLCIARFVPEKDYETLLVSIQEVLRVIPQAKVVLVGDDPLRLRPGLERRASELGIAASVTFLPARSDPERLLNAADLLVLSSIAEGLPNVVLEALACGTQVVATDVGDVRRYLTESQIVPIRTPAALASAITQHLASSGVLRTSGLPAELTVGTLVKSTLRVLRVAPSTSTLSGSSYEPSP